MSLLEPVTGFSSNPPHMRQRLNTQPKTPQNPHLLPTTIPFFQDNPIATPSPILRSHSACRYLIAAKSSSPPSLDRADSPVCPLPVCEAASPRSVSVVRGRGRLTGEVDVDDAEVVVGPPNQPFRLAVESISVPSASVAEVTAAGVVVPSEAVVVVVVVEVVKSTNSASLTHFLLRVYRPHPSTFRPSCHLLS